MNMLMKKILQYRGFGRKVPQYNFPVLNEREVRAGAGILLLGALFSFFHAFYLSNFNYLELFVIFFFIDFGIRVFINPECSPILILSRLLVSTQTPEYTGAIQKKFAWSLGIGMSFVMLLLLFVFDVHGVVNKIMCVLCITLLFLESACGICIGCKLYAWITRNKPELCPGNVCVIKIKEDIQKVSYIQYGIIALAIVCVFVLFSVWM